MTMPEELFKALMDRTVFNYEYIRDRSSRNGPYEVTQLLSSFVMVAGLPRERDIQAGLAGISLDRARREFDLPDFSVIASHANYGIRNVDDLAGMFRNAVAHGNLKFHRAPFGNDIETITLHDQRTERGSRVKQIRHTGPLSLNDLERTLYAFQRIANVLYAQALNRTA